MVSHFPVAHRSKSKRSRFLSLSDARAVKVRPPEPMRTYGSVVVHLPSGPRSRDLGSTVGLRL
ncbi:hypothetical protein SALBM217S_05579 [Streptomyces griseoloalbus]